MIPFTCYAVALYLKTQQFPLLFFRFEILIINHSRYGIGKLIMLRFTALFSSCSYFSSAERTE